MRILGFTAYGGPEVVGWLDVPDPEPGPGQLLVRPAAAGVNPADVKVRSGERQGKAEVTFPMALGREVAGTVVAVGDSPSGWYADQRVVGATAAGTGGLGELVLLDAAATAEVPAGVSMEAASCVPVAVGTALDVLDDWDLSSGGTVLVVGAGGGVGTALTQLARARGLRVVGVASVGKRDVVEQCGAAHVESGDGWASRVRAVVPDGLDAALDCVGAAVLADTAGLLADGGRLTSLASPTAAAEHGGGGVTRRRTGEVFARALAHLGDGSLEPVLSAYAWDDALAAVAVVEAGHATGNVVVTGPR